LRKINTDQKAQAQKKPGLQQQLSQLEEQLSNYKKIDEEYERQHAKEKETLQSQHAQELEKLKADVIAEQKELQVKEFREGLLELSRFLSAAARRRGLGDEVADTEEGKAFEGALSLVYMANLEAVNAAEKLIKGSDDPVLGQDQMPTSVSCKFVPRFVCNLPILAGLAVRNCWNSDIVLG
jgi:hypothetical protein